MNLDSIVDYYQISEVRERWELPDTSTAIYWAVAKNVLKVCMWLTGPFQPAQLGEDGRLVPMANEDGTPAVGEVNAWCYMLEPRQVEPYEFAYSYARDDSGDVPRYWTLQEPCLLSDVLARGVVMLHDLYTAETVLKPSGAEKWQAKSAATKEHASMLRLISAMAADAYKYDYRQQDRAVVESLQAETKRQCGKPMHAQTISKYLHEALSDYPPPYMLEPAALDVKREPLPAAPPLVLDEMTSFQGN